MPLAAGSRIGAYEVTAQIGAGGMGEVYRATDTRLKRQVAIKVLPDALAADPDRLARFQREAEVLASLNHQNIAQLHGLEETDGTKALVMELVEGPTLADRLESGALPVDEAVAIAKQIAAALEAAHEQGVTHRDLKPANVKVRPDGTVKVLDFGLAKLAESAPGSNITALPSALPPSLRTCLRRCLVKDPRQRMRDIGDVRLALEGAFDTEMPATADRGASGESAKPLWRRLLPIVGVSVLLSGLVGAGVWSAMRPGPAAVTKFVLTTAPDASLDVATRVNLAIAPDGTVVYGSATAIYRRRMDAVDPVMIHAFGRDVPSSPFVSPDGAFVGFVELRPPFELRRLPSQGGPVTTITRLDFAPWGVVWGRDNAIVAAGPKGLVRVNVANGTITPITMVSSEKESHRWPSLLPNGRGLLFTVWSGSVDTAQIAMVSFDSGTVSPLGRTGTSPRYSPTGHLLYATNGGLRAVGFDADRMMVTNDHEVTVLENVFVNQTSGAAYYGISETGALVYYASPPATNRVTLALVDTAGKAQPLGTPGPGYEAPRVSRDGKWVAYETQFTDGTDIALFEIGGNAAPLRLTFGGGSRYPVWSADGQRIIFQSERDGNALFWQTSNGTGKAERLTTPPKDESHIPDSVSRDGAWLTFTVIKGQVSEIWRLSLKTMKTEPLIVVPSAKVGQSVLSPDGRWLAYQSTVMAETDIFVAPFPPTGATPYQVPTNDDNHHPIWTPDGRALFFVPGPRRFGRVAITTTPRFSIGTLEQFDLNRTARTGGPNQIRRLDILPDGSHFVGIWPENFVSESSDIERRIVVIQNWNEELRRLMSRE